MKNCNDDSLSGSSDPKHMTGMKRHIYEKLIERGMAHGAAMFYVASGVLGQADARQRGLLDGYTGS